MKQIYEILKVFLGAESQILSFDFIYKYNITSKICAQKI